MKHEFLKALVCPDCGSELDLTISSERSNQVETGTLRCQGHGHVFPITKFVPRFVDADQYADSFSRQRLYVRRHFKYCEQDRSGDARFLPLTSFDAERLRGGLTLEVGCGYGRFVDVAQRLGAEIVGIDLSTHSIELAQDFVGLRPGVHLVQCDLFRLPFRKGYFPHVFSLGVLHHTPDTRAAFQALVPFVAPGGQISIWVYDPQRKALADKWRIVTARLPHPLLYGLCILSQFLFSPIRALPGGGKFNHLIPGAMPGPNRPFWLRVLADFDNFSPKYAYSHTSEEVEGWFRDAGLSGIRSMDFTTSVTGHKVENS